MLLNYVDESGNTGDPSAGGTRFFALGCVIVKDGEWESCLDGLVDFRRRLRKSFGVPMNAELKANSLIRGGGDVKYLDLAPEVRGLIFRAHFDMLTDVPLRVFGVVTDKSKHVSFGRDILNYTWTRFIERIATTSEIESQRALIIHDGGEDDAIRRIARRIRRHMPVGGLGGLPGSKVNSHAIVEDPVPRDSRSSYFVQLADLIAYAAWRTECSPGVAVARIAPQNLWHGLDRARVLTGVNRRRVGRNGTPGVLLTE